MTFEESNTIFELSVTADQTRDVLGLLSQRYFQKAHLDDTERWDFVNGYEHMCNVLSLVEHQVYHRPHSGRSRRYRASKR